MLLVDLGLSPTEADPFAFRSQHLKALLHAFFLASHVFLFSRLYLDGLAAATDGDLVCDRLAQGVCLPLCCGLFLLQLLGGLTHVLRSLMAGGKESRRDTGEQCVGEYVLIGSVEALEPLGLGAQV